MFILLCTLLIPFAVIGGLISRMAGGMPPKLPLGLDQWIYAIPFAFVNWSNYILMLIGYAGALVGKRLGHGRGISLKMPMKEGSKPEVVEKLILWFIDKIPTYWYKVLVLVLTGLATTLLPGIALAITHLELGIAVALSGILKGVAYMIGWKIYPNYSGKGWDQFDTATELGEFFTGFFDYLVLGVCFIILFG